MTPVHTTLRDGYKLLIQLKYYLAMFHNVVEKLSTRYIFHNHEDVSRCANDLISEIYKFKKERVKENQTNNTIFFFIKISIKNILTT